MAVPEQLRMQWDAPLRSAWAASASAFKAEFDESYLNHVAPDRHTSPEYTRDAVVDYDAIFAEQMQTFLGSADDGFGYAATEITAITATTQLYIKTAIEAGIEEGLDKRAVGRMIVDRIEGVNGASALARARMIASTEMHNISTFTVDKLARDTGLPLRKEWLPIIDGRERPDHHAMDGHPPIDMDKSFRVPPPGGVSMARPGDFGAPAAQVINCRCALIFITK
ncbi:phage head morphogenesis protein [bacterium]|nr:phage head morphogenesis protein [bacterium]